MWLRTLGFWLIWRPGIVWGGPVVSISSPCSFATDLMVPSGEKHALLELKAVLDSASGITAISVPLLEKMAAHFDGVKMSCPPQEDTIGEDGRAFQWCEDVVSAAGGV